MLKPEPQIQIYINGFRHIRYQVSKVFLRGLVTWKDEFPSDFPVLVNFLAKVPKAVYFDSHFDFLLFFFLHPIIYKNFVSKLTFLESIGLWRIVEAVP